MLRDDLLAKLGALALLGYMLTRWKPDTDVATPPPSEDQEER